MSEPIQKWGRVFSGVLLLFLLNAGVWAQSETPNAPAEPRFALLIGNNEYSGITNLKNPVNDATDMAAALRRLGFVVEVLTNANQVQIEEAVVQLGRNLSSSKDAIGVFFFAGHGVQSGGQNYLIPSNTSVVSEAFLRSRAVASQAVLDTLAAAGNRVNVVILDACRDNPYGWNRSSARGLALIGVQPPSSMIVYATSAGSAAEDGDGRNGVFTGELLRHIETPGLDISEIFRLTGASVRQKTNGQQIPAIYNQFFDRCVLQDSDITVDAITAATENVLPDYNSVAEVPSVSSVDAVTAAFANVQPLEESIPMVRVIGGTYRMDSSIYTTVDSFYMARTEITQAQWQRVMGTDVVRQRDMANPSWAMRGQSDTLPMYYVSWYEALVFCNRQSMQEGLTPVYSLSGFTDPDLWGAIPSGSNDALWDLVQADWQANGYRLPTEAEWEYAARGGMLARGTPYAGSSDATNIGWINANSNRRPHLVGTKQANELGLYDMCGNLWEWCWDWYGDSFEGDKNPRGPDSGVYRVKRGGSWDDYESGATVFTRYTENPHARYDFNGFRVVRND